MFVYRFLDRKGEILYVGKTQSMTKRMYQHFGGEQGHLPSRCYKEVKKIQYIYFSNDADGDIYEIYYINKFHPKYNTQDCREKDSTLILNDFAWNDYIEDCFNDKEFIKADNLYEQVEMAKKNIEKKYKEQFEDSISTFLNCECFKLPISASIDDSELINLSEVNSINLSYGNGELNVADAVITVKYNFLMGDKKIKFWDLDSDAVGRNCLLVQQEIIKNKVTFYNNLVPALNCAFGQKFNKITCNF